MKKKGSDLICMRPDSIVEARFSLTKKQNDIMDMVFASIEDDGRLEYEINIEKYAKLYNLIDKSDVYGEVKKAVKSFEGKGFSIVEKINDKKENRIYFSWFSSIQYADGEGKIIFELGNKLKQLFLEMKRAVFYNIQYTLNFRSIYSKRLYYYLKLYEDTGSRIDNIDTLKEKLECPEGYKNYADFNRYVLKPAYEEINGNSDLSFEYDPKKTGRKITHIKFEIKSSVRVKPGISSQEELAATEIEDNTLTEQDINVQKVIEILQSHSVNKLDALKILEAAQGDIENIRKCYNYALTQNVDSIVPYMISLVKPGLFSEPQSKRGSTKDPKGRGYSSQDAKDMKYKLLGWHKYNDNGQEYEQGRIGD